MFVALMRFGARKARAPDLMAGHNAWLAKGFEEGAFLAAGSLKPAGGGALLGLAATRADFEARIDDDPFVAEGVVEAEIVEFDPARTDPRLDFLKGAAP